MNQTKEIILASGSPRRTELLAQLGVNFSVLVTDIDESRRGAESPTEYVKRMAREKSLAGWQMSGAGLPVLGADTIVLLDDIILGKPDNREQAAEMLRMMSNRTHLVLSAVALTMDADHLELKLNTTRVTFSEMPEAFIRRYCCSEEPMDKAGAYAIQGLPGRYVSRIEGSYSGVMGLPLYETGCLLEFAGILI